MANPCAFDIAQDFDLDEDLVNQMIDYFKDMPLEMLRQETDDLVSWLAFHRKSNLVNQAHTKEAAKQNGRRIYEGETTFDTKTQEPKVKSIKAIYDNFLALLVGNSWKKSKAHTWDSVWATGQALKQDRMGRVISEFEENYGIGTFSRMRKDKQFRDDFITELDSWTTKPKRQNVEAHTLAGLVFNEKHRQVSHLNLFGAGMRWRDDHVTIHWHNPVTIAEVKFKEWAKFITPLLDLNQSFGGKKPSRYLRSVYDTLTKGEGDVHDVITFKSTKEQLNYKRELIFKNVDAWKQYNARFGYEDPFDAVFQNMDVIDERIALYERFGANPRQAFGRLLQRLEKDGVFDDHNALDRATKGGWRRKNRLISSWNQLSGEGYIVGNPSISKFTNGMMSFQIITKLGKATISAFNDIGISSAILHSQGRGPFSAYKDVLSQIHRRSTQSDKVRQAELNLVLRQLGVGFDGIIGSAMSRWVDLSSIAGRTAKMAQNYFNLNGLNQWTDFWREGFARASSVHFAEQLKKSWNDLPKNFRARMDEYGISQSDWKDLQKIDSFSLKERLSKDADFADVLEDLSDERFITPDWISEQGGSTALRQKLSRFFVNESKIAVPEADAAQRATYMRTFDRGSVLGATALMIAQFRTYPLAMAQKVYPRMYEMGLPALLHVTPLLGLGYASLAVKDVIRGKEPRDITNPQTLLDAGVQSGMLGLFGDLFVAETGRYHSSWDETLLGVHYETFKDIGELTAGLVSGKSGAKEALETLRNNTPYMNLFYTEMAYNYLIHYQLMETFNPGYIQRMEGWTKGVDQQQYIDALRPSNFVRYGGLR